MTHLLDNPVFNALATGDKHLGSGNERVRIFKPEVSPFAGIKDDIYAGLEELKTTVVPGRRILLAVPRSIELPAGWKLLNLIEGLQFVLNDPVIKDPGFSPVELTDDHIPEMIELTKLTRPGPFDERTIDFGFYKGIFIDGKLAAMAGQRLHVENYSEISAVCTHPDHTGKGYAAKLLQLQINFIAAENKIPFLHVRSDNERAIELYERLGFVRRIPMNFYFLRKL